MCSCPHFSSGGQLCHCPLFGLGARATKVCVVVYRDKHVASLEDVGTRRAELYDHVGRHCNARLVVAGGDKNIPRHNDVGGR